MRFSTATATALLGLCISSSAAILAKRQIDSGFWRLSALIPGDATSTTIPIVLPTDPTNEPVYLSTGSPTETQVCIELLEIVDAQGVHYKGAKIVQHPTVDEDLFLWKTYGAKYLMSSTRINIAGTRGDWTFVSGDGVEVLALDGDTAAKESDGAVHFGSDIPESIVGNAITVVGEQVDAC